MSLSKSSPPPFRHANGPLFTRGDFACKSHIKISMISEVKLLRSSQPIKKTHTLTPLAREMLMQIFAEDDGGTLRCG